MNIPVTIWRTKLRLRLSPPKWPSELSGIFDSLEKLLAWETLLWSDFMRLIIFTCTFLLSAMPSWAATWYVYDGNFDDGGSISGQFDYDFSTTTYSNISITSAAGSLRTGQSYSLIHPRYGADENDLELTDTAGSANDQSGASYLGIFFQVTGLPDTGGTFLDGFAREGTCSITQTNCSNIDDIRIGSFTYSTTPNEDTGATAVPRPASFPLLLAGLIGLIMGRRSRHRNV